MRLRRLRLAPPRHVWLVIADHGEGKNVVVVGSFPFVPTLRDRVASVVSGLLGLLGLDADPIQSREHILLSNILQRAWQEGRDMDLASLIREIQSRTEAPPIPGQFRAMLDRNLAEQAQAQAPPGEPDVARGARPQAQPQRSGQPQSGTRSQLQLRDPTDEGVLLMEFRYGQGRVLATTLRLEAGAQAGALLRPGNSASSRRWPVTTFCRYTIERPPSNDT